MDLEVNLRKLPAEGCGPRNILKGQRKLCFLRGKKFLPGKFPQELTFCVPSFLQCFDSALCPQFSVVF